MSPLVRLTSLDQFAAVNLTTDGGYIKAKKQIPLCVEVTLGWSLEDGKNAHNVLHASYVGAFNGSQAVANTILTSLVNHANWAPFAGFLSPTTALLGLTLRDLNTVEQPLITSSVAGKPGTSASPALPNEVAVVGTLLTAGAGKQNRGRMYVPGWATNAMGTGNIVAAGAITALNNWLSIIAGTFSASGYQLGIGHLARQAYTSPNGTHHDARPAGVVPVLSLSAKDNHWDTIRRRGLK